jgi:hypothetical protein
LSVVSRPFCIFDFGFQDPRPDNPPACGPPLSKGGKSLHSTPSSFFFPHPFPVNRERPLPEGEVRLDGNDPRLCSQKIEPASVKRKWTGCRPSNIARTASYRRLPIPAVVSWRSGCQSRRGRPRPPCVQPCAA